MKQLSPPGTTEQVTARRALVLAPHYDDEVLGCGGLIVQLAASGAEVEIAFLTDGSGGDEGAPAQASPSGSENSVRDDAEAYAARRREEAVCATDVLGVRDLRFFDLPDGGLEQHLKELERLILESLAEHQPDLVLVPSPLEITGDHRAAFAALHRVLHHDRGEFADLRVFAYEINHPFYPNLLVDVSDQITLLRLAMDEYPSQQERHDYLAAAVGLCHFRTHTLGPDVEAAEGFFQLDLQDFRTNSLARLVTRMGGQPEVLPVADGPLVSVIVRTKDRPEFLQEALASLAMSDYRNLQVVLVNDGGQAPETPEDFPFPLEVVDLQPGRGRAAAAQAGIEASQGEYVSFLDDDDLAFPEHYSTLVGALGAGVRVVYTDAAVGIYELGERGWMEIGRRLPYSRDFDRSMLLVDNYIPLNTLLIERALCAEVGDLDSQFETFEDWDWLIRLSAVADFHHLASATCEYRHFRGSGHHALGADAQNAAEMAQGKARILAKHADRLSPDVLAAATSTLRTESVLAAEGLRAAQSDAAELRAELDATLRHFHSLKGETETLRVEREQLLAARDEHQAELARLFSEEKVLRGVASDHEAHLARTYAEIERLNGLIRSMEQSRAWRLQQLFSRGH